MEQVKVKVAEEKVVPKNKAADVKTKVVLTPGTGQSFKTEAPVIRSIFGAEEENFTMSRLSLNNITSLEMVFAVDTLKDKVVEYLGDIISTGLVQDVVSDKSLAKIGVKGVAICAQIDIDAIKKKQESSSGSVFRKLNTPSENMVDFNNIPDKLLTIAENLRIDQVISNNKRFSLIQLSPLKILIHCVLAKATPNLLNAAKALANNFTFSYVIKGSLAYFNMTKSRDISDIYKTVIGETRSILTPLSGATLDLEAGCITTVDLSYSNREVLDYATSKVVEHCYGAGNAVLVDPYKAKILDKIKNEDDIKYYREALYSGSGASQITRIVGFVLPLNDFIIHPKNTGTLFAAMQSNTINVKKIKSMFSGYLSQDRQPLLSLTNDGLLLIPELHKLLFKLSGANTPSLKIAFNSSPESIAVRLTRV